MSEETTLRASDLGQFTGTEQWYQHGINRAVLFTDGAKYVADAAGAYWLLDEIAIIQSYDKQIAGEAFQVWKLFGSRRPVSHSDLRRRQRQYCLY
jgi:hypothetical protein